MVNDKKQSRKLSKERSRDVTFFSRASWLIRHRWIGLQERRVWLCHPKAVSLYGSDDPLCYGCGSEIAFRDFPNPDRYRKRRIEVEHDFSLSQLESFGLRLDLLIEELKRRQLGVA